MKHLFWLSQFLLFSFLLSAQNTALDIGLQAHEDGDHAMAIAKLEQALSPEKINRIFPPDKISEARYYLYRSYLTVASDPLLADRYQRPLLKAADYLTKAMYDTDPDMANMWQRTAQVEHAVEVLWSQLYSEGLRLYSTDIIPEAIPYFQTAAALDTTNMLPFQLLANCHLALRDTAQCISYYEKAIKRYRFHYMTSLDADVNKEGPYFALEKEQIGGLCLQLAVLHESAGDTRRALQVLRFGQSIYPEEQGLTRQEVVIYLRHPELFAEAEPRLKSLIQEFPDDLAIQTAFADLLMDLGRHEEAVSYLKNRHARQPDSYEANRNLATFYINQASANHAKMKETTDSDQKKKISDQIRQLLLDGYPYLEKLHQLKPKESIWIDQLITAAIYIGKEKEADLEKWKAIQKGLSK